MNMTIPKIETINSEEEARDLCVDWQAWQADQALSYDDLANWQALFEAIGTKFNLTDELKENGLL